MATTAKLDLYKERRAEYATPKKPTFVDVKRATYLTITGQGEPGGDVFTTKLGALYGVAFTIKMTEKFAGRDYAVCKLEALWWGREETGDFSHLPREEWNWAILIRTPDFIKRKHLTAAIQTLIQKGKGPEVAEVTLERLTEGRCVQMLHVGPYDEEPETIAQMRACAEQNGVSLHGRHHEIYLSDPRRVAPERLRTILRLPVQ